MNIKLLSAIKQSGLRQWELAARVGISESVLSRLVNERLPVHSQSDAIKNRVAKVLRLQVKSLFPNYAQARRGGRP